MKPAQLVAGEQGMVNPLFAGHAHIVGVRLDGADQVGGPAALGQDARPDPDVLVQGGIALVVEVVDQARDAPVFHILRRISRA